MTQTCSATDTRPVPPPADTLEAYLQARNYCDLGWHLLALAPESKRPLEARWTTQSSALNGPALMSHLGRGGNLGLLHARSGTCTLDIDEPDWSAVALGAVGLKLSDLEQGLCIEGRRGVKPIFRTTLNLPRVSLTWPDPLDTRETKRRITVFELRGGDCQDVLPPSIHPSGIPYRWKGTLPFTHRGLRPLPKSLEKVWTDFDAMRHRLEAACPWETHKPAPESRKTSQTSPFHPTRPGPISSYNAETDPASLLRKHGYRDFGHDRWLYPGSQSGEPGVIVHPARHGQKATVWSFHPGDPLCNAHANDAFDLLTLLEHGGDRTLALQSLRSARN